MMCIDFNILLSWYVPALMLEFADLGCTIIYDSCSFVPPSGVKGMLRRLGSPALTNALSAHTADDLCEASAYRFDEPPKKSRLDDLPSKCKLQIKMS